VSEDLTNNIEELGIGQNLTYHSGSENLDIACGLQEMPWSITYLHQLALLKQEKAQKTELPIMSCFQEDGLNRHFSIPLTNGLFDSTTLLKKGN